MSNHLTRQDATQARTEAQAQTTAQDTGGYTCKCCDPPNRLVLRPELGMVDNLPRFGLCVLHNPVSVHEWDGTQYVLRGGWSLHEGSAIMDKDGTVITQVQPEAPTPDQVMRLGDDEQDPNADARGRAGTRVDLGRDAFYRS